MRGLDLPLIPISDQESGEFLLFLPSLDTDELETVEFQVNEEENILEVACIYGENEDGEPVGHSYPIEIDEINDQAVENLKKLVVLHPSDQEIDELTDDPDIKKDLEELFEYIDQLEEQLEESPAN